MVCLLGVLYLLRICNLRLCWLFVWFDLCANTVDQWFVGVFVLDFGRNLGVGVRAGISGGWGFSVAWVFLGFDVPGADVPGGVLLFRGLVFPEGFVASGFGVVDVSDVLPDEFPFRTLTSGL